MNKYIFISIGLVATSFVAGCADYKTTYNYKSVYKDYIIPPKSLSFDVDNNEIYLPAPCPDWRDNPVINPDNSQMSNLGCASLNNKAQMVANPQDLIQGRSNSNINTESTVRTIESYYNGELTPTISSDESSTTSDSN